MKSNVSQFFRALGFGAAIGGMTASLPAAEQPAVAAKAAASAGAEASSPAVAQKPAPKPKLTEAQIAELVRDLGARNFTVREAATKRLQEAGRPAIKPLTQAAQSGELEVALRALRILESLFTSGSQEDYLAAEAALEELQRSKEIYLSMRAANVLASMGDVRERRAIAAIRDLDGIVKSDANQLGFMPNNLPPGEDMMTTVILNKRWKGHVEGLKHLENLRFLRTLYVVQGVLPDEAVAQLEQKMPNIRVQLRGGACLGVGGIGVADGCEISIVNPGSAAAKAGLRAGDLIVAFNGKRGEKEDEPLNFERLVDLIKELDPGDKVPVLIRRNGREETKDVVLDDWK